MTSIRARLAERMVRREGVGLLELVTQLVEETTDESSAQADVFDELAERGRFDEHGGELSDGDWADSQ